MDHLPLLPLFECVMAKLLHKLKVCFIDFLNWIAIIIKLLHLHFQRMRFQIYGFSRLSVRDLFLMESVNGFLFIIGLMFLLRFVSDELVDEHHIFPSFWFLHFSCQFEEYYFLRKDSLEHLRMNKIENWCFF